MWLSWAPVRSQSKTETRNTHLLLLGFRPKDRKTENRLCYSFLVLDFIYTPLDLRSTLLTYRQLTHGTRHTARDTTTSTKLLLVELGYFRTFGPSFLGNRVTISTQKPSVADIEKQRQQNGEGGIGGECYASCNTSEFRSFLPPHAQYNKPAEAAGGGCRMAKDLASGILLNPTQKL